MNTSSANMQDNSSIPFSSSGSASQPAANSQMSDLPYNFRKAMQPQSTRRRILPSQIAIPRRPHTIPPSFPTQPISTPSQIASTRPHLIRPSFPTLSVPAPSQMVSGLSQPAPQYLYSYPSTVFTCQLHQPTAASASSQSYHLNSTRANPPPTAHATTSNANVHPIPQSTNSSSQNGTNSLIDSSTPEHIAKMILNTIAVEPYDLEGDETRSPELFIEHFETYANLLNLNEEQKRISFAGLAYTDDALCFDALKFDKTFDDMKANFIEVARRIEQDSTESESMIETPEEKKPSLCARLRKAFQKLLK